MDGQPGIAGEGQPNVYCSVNTNRGGYRRPVISFSAVVLDVVKYKGSPMDQLQGGRGRQASIDTPPKGFTQGQANGRAHHLPTGASSWSAIELLKAQVITAHLEQGGVPPQEFVHCFSHGGAITEEDFQGGNPG